MGFKIILFFGETRLSLALLGAEFKHSPKKESDKIIPGFILKGNFCVNF